MTQLVISFELDGRHRWPDAPPRYYDFANTHRHLFKFICWYEIDKSDSPNRRDKELFELRREAIEALKANFGMTDYPLEFGGMSVEGIADWLKAKMGFSKVFCGESDFFGAIV
jgi:hypothetical protein